MLDRVTGKGPCYWHREGGFSSVRMLDHVIGKGCPDVRPCYWQTERGFFVCPDVDRVIGKGKEVFRLSGC